MNTTRTRQRDQVGRCGESRHDNRIVMLHGSLIRTKPDKVIKSEERGRSDIIGDVEDNEKKADNWVKYRDREEVRQ